MSVSEDLERYGFEGGNHGDEEGTPDSYTTFSYLEAKEHAQRYHLQIVTYAYEFSEMRREPDDDFRPRHDEGEDDEDG